MSSLELLSPRTPELASQIQEILTLPASSLGPPLRKAALAQSILAVLTVVTLATGDVEC